MEFYQGVPITRTIIRRTDLVPAWSGLRGRIRTGRSFTPSEARSLWAGKRPKAHPKIDHSIIEGQAFYESYLYQIRAFLTA